MIKEQDIKKNETIINEFLKISNDLNFLKKNLKIIYKQMKFKDIEESLKFITKNTKNKILFRQIKKFNKENIVIDMLECKHSKKFIIIKNIIDSFCNIKNIEIYYKE